MYPPQPPVLPLPEPLRGADAGSFAEATLTHRLPGIARRTARENDWPAEIEAALLALAEEMPRGRLRPLLDGGLDAPAWARYLAPYPGQDWLAPPWFLAETYFFRRILEATEYFQPGPGAGIDPYALQKRRGLAPVIPALRPFSARVTALLQANSDGSDSCRDGLAELLRLAIWGNQADLSLWPADESNQTAGPNKAHQQDPNLDPLLSDEADEAARYLTGSARSPGRVDFILDNSGVELAFDLGLADFLLAASLAQDIRFHVKPYPTYVSDSTAADVVATIAHLASASDPAIQATGARLGEYMETGSLCMQTHHFWVSPLSGWEMPVDLRADLSRSSLLISKGDANYRRWLGDRHWPFTTPLAEILSYLPAPWLALRILKANLAAGLPPGASAAAAKTDPDWLYSGHWGVIQFVSR
jgi:uncharacterized protein with ATP-grasp and redox domains